MENSLAARLKEETKVAHQELEKLVVGNLKAIRSDKDYVQLLRKFYSFFFAIEGVAESIIIESEIIDISMRRDSGFIARDIAILGGELNRLPLTELPEIGTLAEAMGAMYVMEGSVLGGPYIVQMLSKLGVNHGVSFFSGYGDQTPIHWSKFIAALNTLTDPIAQEQAIKAAKETFFNFGKLFSSSIE